MTRSERHLEDADPRVEELKARAAIVGLFDPFDLIDGALDDATEMKLLNSLARDIEEVVLTEKTFWKMSANARHRELPRALARGDLNNLLERTTPAPGDCFGQYLLELLSGRSIDYGKLTPSQLMDVAVAQDFVNHARGSRRPAGAADPRWVLARIDDRQRLDHVAPKLVGRKPQLAALRRYAGDGTIVPPLHELPKPDRVPGKLPWLRPVLLTGIGGSGKSALVAEMVKTIRKEDWSGPITVLLDFDEPNLSLGSEREWTAELSRQIGRARAELDGDMDSLRQEMLQRTREPSYDLKVVDVMMLRLAEILSRSKRKQDLVVVVDTFEEVMVQSDMQLPEDVTIEEHNRALELSPFGLVLGWLDRLKSLKAASGKRAFANVRAIVAGRAAPFPQENGRLHAWFSATMEIGAFAAGEAAEFLKYRRKKVTILSDQRIQKIVAIPDAQWYPLLLIILILYAQGRTAKEMDELIADIDDSGLYRSKTAIAILYSRFLDRIKAHQLYPKGGGVPRRIPADDIRRLAHPGLALRIVTPALIREVLAIPCGLGTIDEQRAHDLFVALAKEVWLVEHVGKDEVRHVPALRRVMLPMLCGDENKSPVTHGEPLQDIVREVQARASQWYAARGTSDRGNVLHEAYYRAFLRDTDLIAGDALLRQQVSGLAGEDVHAMPIEARSLLLQRQLSREERAALPTQLRYKAQTELRSRKAKSSVVHASRTQLRKEEENTLESESGAPEVYRNVLENRNHGSRVEDLFNSADFVGIEKISRQHLSDLQPDGRLPISLLTGGLTTHWIWKWALANLATGGADEVVSRWKLSRFDGSTRRGASAFLAIAAVATGSSDFARPGNHQPDPLPKQNHVDLDGMRLLSLGLAEPPGTLNLQVSLVQFLGAAFGSLPGRPDLTLIADTPLAVALARLKKKKQIRYLDVEDLISRKDVIHFFPSGPLSLADVRRLVRGRTPELYAPIRGALIDVVRYEPKTFSQVITQIQETWNMWPVDLETRRLMVELQKTRQADFLLLRVIEFLDVCGLLGDALSALRKKSALQRVLDVAKLFSLYDKLLLAGVTRKVRRPSSRP